MARNKPVLRDPMTALPAELQLMIFQHLKLTDVVRSTRVSKIWLQQLTSATFTPVYHVLEVSHDPRARVAAQSNFINKCIEYSRGGVKRAYLDIPKVESYRGAWRNLTSFCPNLQVLVLKRIGFNNEHIVSSIPLLRHLSVLFLGAAISIDLRQLEEILKVGTNLRKVEMRGVISPEQPGIGTITKLSTLPKTLRYLHIYVILGAAILGLDGNTDMIHDSQLRDLHLEGKLYYSEIDRGRRPGVFNDFPNLESLALINTKIYGKSFSTPTSLRRLHLEKINCHHLEEGDFALSLAGLEDLTLTPTPMDWHRFFTPETTNDATLKTLNIAPLPGTEIQDLQAFFAHPRLTSLEKLTIKYDAFADSCAVLLFPLQNLKSLHMIGARRLTGVGLRKWVDGGLPALKELTFENCMDISDDAFKYAKACGIKVAVYKKGVVESGARVRGLYR